jgi:hypothetical protein
VHKRKSVGVGGVNGASALGKNRGCHNDLLVRNGVGSGGNGQ